MESIGSSVRVVFVIPMFAWAVAGCSDGEPVVLETIRVVSPDSRWEAVLEKIDNGLGFGQGMVYDEVHVQPVGSSVVHHGDESASLIFYAEATPTSPSLEWAADRTLVVTLSGSTNPGRQVVRFMDVHVEYRVRGVQDVP